MFRECSSNYLVKNLSFSLLSWELIKTLMNTQFDRQTTSLSFSGFVLHQMKRGQRTLVTILCLFGQRSNLN